MPEVDRRVPGNDGHPDIGSGDPRPKPFTPAALQQALHELDHVAVPLQVDVESAVEEADLPDRGNRLTAEEELEEAVVDAHLVDREERAAGVARVVDGEVAHVHRSEERGGYFAVGYRAPRDDSRPATSPRRSGFPARLRGHSAFRASTRTVRTWSICTAAKAVAATSAANSVNQPEIERAFLNPASPGGIGNAPFLPFQFCRPPGKRGSSEALPPRWHQFQCSRNCG